VLELVYAICGGLLGGAAGFALFLVLCVLDAFPDGSSIAVLGPILTAMFGLPVLGAIIGFAVGPVVAKYDRRAEERSKQPPN